MALTDPDQPVEPPARRPARRRTAWTAAAGLGVAAVLGGGAWGLHLWSSQGPQPALALPGDTLAYVAVDLDPTGGQKVQAFETLRKFPSLTKELGLDSQDDLRRSLVEQVADDSGCEVGHDALAGWAGDRAAVAVVPHDDPEVVAVVQVADAEKAARGLKATAADCGGGELGFAFEGDWVVLARSTAVAKRVVADAARRSLQDDQDYQDLTAAAGDSGVVTVYAAPEAGPALLEVLEEQPWLGQFALSPIGPGYDPVSLGVTGMSFSGMLAADGPYDDVAVYEPTPEELAIQERYESWDQLTKAERDQLDRDAAAFYESQYGPEGDLEPEYPEPELPEDLRSALEDFSGLGGVLRFDDGAVELEVVTDPDIAGQRGVYARGGGTAVEALPEGSAVASGSGLADGWAERLLTRISGLTLPFSTPADGDPVRAFEDAMGLSLPEDLEALGGDAVALVAAPGLDPEALFEGRKDVDVALRVTGDADRIEAALDKVRKAAGKDVAAYLQSRATEDGVVVGPDAGYLDELASAEDRLDDSDRFRQVVPDADDAVTVTYVDFDAGSWLVDAVGKADRGDAEPFDAVGLTVTEDGDQQRVVVRATFD